MHFIEHININDYNYSLPEDRIAYFPVNPRDASKLLIYNKEKQSISESQFFNIVDFLTQDSLLLMNNTKVLPARLLFKKKTGSTIEIFCLEPLQGNNEVTTALSSKQNVLWKCLIGNKKRWKNEYLESIADYQGCKISLKASIQNQESGYDIINFEWAPHSFSFAEILNIFGNTPLPPYIKRESEISDNTNYQTIYASQEGSVAAPTAGLHFTPTVIDKIRKKGISIHEITLHVGAGTFKPISSPDISQHQMHAEWFVVEKNLIKELLKLINSKSIVATGTTTVRCLESLYWLGVKIYSGLNSLQELTIEQWFPYKNNEENVSAQMALESLLQWMDSNKIEHFYTATSIIIVPGYQFRLVNSMITNFHQPQSTLLLLVSAFIGDKWKDIYNYALQHNFRFLSYGDCCYFL